MTVLFFLPLAVENLVTSVSSGVHKDDRVETFRFAWDK